ncbi:transporter substrate-binding domain-containing protein [Gudongella sp. DL1XJH-153]|uniref:transporter substrate-binding domain-containing protein n=1 Tax=Gudongella sp. DL1XJH-153 TaxID=3409804 RepID=UPI003BB51552
MKRVILLICIVLVITFIHPSFADAQVYKVAGDQDFPPYEYLDDDGKFKGFNVDLIKAISLVTGMEFEFLPMSWGNAYVSVHQGKADIIQGMKESDERRNKFLFSESLLMNSQSIFVLDENTDIRDENDLAGKLVALNKEDTVLEEISEIENASIIEYDTLGEALDSLLDGEVDALVGNTLTVNYLCKEKNSIELVKIVGDSINEQKYSIAVHKNNTVLMNKLNEGINEIQENGMYDSLYRKWFGAPIRNTKTDYEFLWKMTLGLIAALVLLIYIIKSANDKLKAVINAKTEEQKALIYELRHYDKLQFMNQIISSIAHEIRNPLTSIKIYTNQIRDKLDNREFMLAASEDIPVEIDRIDGLIKEFMEYASPRRPVIANINLYEEIVSSIKLVKFQINKIKIEVDIDKSLRVKFDISQFKQIIINILLNSNDAVKDIEKPIIQISAMEDGEEVELVFKDNGYGMKDENLHYIFEPFYTTKEYGNGVGMFVVKQIIDDNGGSIIAESDGENLGMSIKVRVKRGDIVEE